MGHFPFCTGDHSSCCYQTLSGLYLCRLFCASPMSENISLRSLSLTYALTWPPFLLSLLVHKHFILWSIPGYYHSLLVPMTGWIFYSLVLLYPQAEELIVDSWTWSYVTACIILLLISLLPAASESPVSDASWQEIMRGGLTALPAYFLIPPWKTSPKGTPLRSRMIYMLIYWIAYHLLATVVDFSLDRREAVIYWLGSCIWLTITTLLLLLLSCIVERYLLDHQLSTEKSQLATKGDACHARVTAIFLTLILMTNIVSVRCFYLQGMLITAGLFTYPFTFLCTDILSEIYSKKQTEEVVKGGFLASLWMLLLISMILYFQGKEENTMILFFGFMPGMVVGSVIAYLLGQWIDVSLFHLLKAITRSHHLWFRNNVATIISQVVDTVIFGTIVWIIWPMLNGSIATPFMSWSVGCRLIRNECFIKTIIALFDTPLLYFLLYLIRKNKKGSDLG